MPLEILTNQSNAETVSGSSQSRGRARKQREIVSELESEQELTTVAGLRAEVTHSLRKRRQTLAISMGLMGLSVVLSLVFFYKINALSGFYFDPVTTLALAYIAFLAPLLAISATAGYMIWTRTSEMKRQVRQLRAVGTNGAASIVIDILTDSDSSTRRYAALGLQEMLPKWSEEDLAALRNDQRIALRTVLLREDVEPALTPEKAILLKPFLELRFAICQAYGRIGGQNELTALRELIARPLDTAADHALQDAAETAAMQLQARLGRQLPTHVLLRASDAPLNGSDELLRAAHPVTVTPEHQLMRPGIQGRDGGIGADSCGRDARAPS